MDVTERDRSLFDGQGCLVVLSVRSEHAVSELHGRIDSAGLWDGAPDSTSHSLDLVRTLCWLMGVFASHLHTSVGLFARSVGPWAPLFAQSAGPQKPLFASR
jgi:hypothetical protein